MQFKIHNGQVLLETLIILQTPLFPSETNSNPGLHFLHLITRFPYCGSYQYSGIHITIAVPRRIDRQVRKSKS